MSIGECALQVPLARSGLPTKYLKGTEICLAAVVGPFLIARSSISFNVY